MPMLLETSQMVVDKLFWGVGVGVGGATGGNWGAQHQRRPPMLQVDCFLGHGIRGGHVANAAGHAGQENATIAKKPPMP